MQICISMLRPFHHLHWNLFFLQCNHTFSECDSHVFTTMHIHTQNSRTTHERNVFVVFLLLSFFSFLTGRWCRFSPCLAIVLVAVFSAVAVVVVVATPAVRSRVSTIGGHLSLVSEWHTDWLCLIYSLGQTAWGNKLYNFLCGIMHAPLAQS